MISKIRWDLDCQDVKDLGNGKTVEIEVDGVGIEIAFEPAVVEAVKVARAAMDACDCDCC
jgi:hypothetical protein